MSFADALKELRTLERQFPEGSFTDPLSEQEFSMTDIDRVEWTYEGKRYRSDKNYDPQPGSDTLFNASKVTVYLETYAPRRYNQELLQQHFNETLEPLVEYVFPS